jgi:hypothetical protein
MTRRQYLFLGEPVSRLSIAVFLVSAVAIGIGGGALITWLLLP